MSGTALLTWMVWSATGALGLFALALLYVALLRDRGRGLRRCPRCWYDMSGTPQSRTCSECGHMAKSERAMHRSRKRWGWAAVSGMLAIAAVLTAVYGPTDPQAAKPVWWLMTEMHATSERGNLARTELFERVRDGRLTVTQQRRIADRILVVQADADAQWLTVHNGVVNPATQWGTLFEEMWLHDSLTDEKVDRYLRTGWEIGFAVHYRPRVRAGEPIPVLLQQGRPRFATPHRVGRLSFVGRMVSVEGSSGYNNPLGRFGLGANFFGGWRMPLTLHGIDEAGVHEITLTMEVGTVPQRAQFDVQHDDMFRDALIRWTREEVLTIEVLPPDTSSVRLVHVPQHGPIIRDALQVELEMYKQVQVGDSTYNTRPALILVHPIPIDISFDVFARAGDREKHLGSIYAYGGREDVQWTHGIRFDPVSLFPDDDFVDVIFRAGPAAAKRTVDIETIWDGEIVIEQVRLLSETAARARNWARQTYQD